MTQGGRLDWLLDDLVERIPQIDKAVILSGNGLAIGSSALARRDDAQFYQAETVKAALTLTPEVPVIMCDARQRTSGRTVLVALVEHVLHMLTAAAGEVRSAR